MSLCLLPCSTFACHKLAVDAHFCLHFPWILELTLLSMNTGIAGMGLKRANGGIRGDKCYSVDWIRLYIEHVMTNIQTPV